MSDMMEGTWDARQYFVQEIVGRLHVVLDCNYIDVKKWFEALYDFYCICSPMIRERSGEKQHIDFMSRIDKLELLLFGTTNDKGEYLNNDTKKINQEKAYKEIRLLMMDIHNVVWLSDVYMKRAKKVKPSNAVLEME